MTQLTPLEQSLSKIIEDFILRSGCEEWSNNASAVVAKLEYDITGNPQIHHIGTCTITQLLSDYKPIKQQYSIPDSTEY